MNEDEMLPEYNAYERLGQLSSADHTIKIHEAVARKLIGNFPEDYQNSIEKIPGLNFKNPYGLILGWIGNKNGFSAMKEELEAIEDWPDDNHLTLLELIRYYRFWATFKSPGSDVNRIDHMDQFGMNTP